MRPVPVAAARPGPNVAAVATVAVAGAALAAGAALSVLDLRYGLLGAAVLWGWTQLVGL